MSQIHILSVYLQRWIYCIYQVPGFMCHVWLSGGVSIVDAYTLILNPINIFICLSGLNWFTSFVSVERKRLINIKLKSLYFKKSYFIFHYLGPTYSASICLGHQIFVLLFQSSMYWFLMQKRVHLHTLFYLTKVYVTNFVVYWQTLPTVLSHINKLSRTFSAGFPWKQIEKASWHQNRLSSKKKKSISIYTLYRNVKKIYCKRKQ